MAYPPCGKLYVEKMSSTKNVAFLATFLSKNLHLNTRDNTKLPIYICIRYKYCNTRNAFSLYKVVLKSYIF